MSSKKRAHKRTKKTKEQSILLPRIVSSVVLLLIIGSFGTYHFIRVNAAERHIPSTKIDPNFGVQNKVIDFFEANDAAEMIPIIKCESRFRHYEPDGTILKNKEGSSAIGVAQILSSVHPDPKLFTVYNRRYDMDLTTDDFDITTLEGNMGYALVLYKVRGVKDWECSHQFRFR